MVLTYYKLCLTNSKRTKFYCSSVNTANTVSTPQRGPRSNNIATKDQKKSFVASGGNIAKICVALM